MVLITRKWIDLCWILRQRAANLKYVRTGERLNITGKCNGRSINEDRDDDDREKHKMPNVAEPKEG
jgi:hypothetical protein